MFIIKGGAAGRVGYAIVCLERQEAKTKKNLGLKSANLLTMSKSLMKIDVQKFGIV